jgi:hypothetical protein
MLPRSARLPLLAALVVGLARLPVLLALRDTHYPFELFSGSVAAGLLDGLDVELGPLTIVSHIRGGPLFGALAAPLYGLFGPSLGLLKLLPVVWHAVTVGVLVAVLQRLACRRAALAFAALLVCAPPLLAKLSVMAFASHLESLLPVVLGLWVALPLLERDEAPGKGRLFALGLVVGFAGFFHLQSLLGLALLLAMLLWLKPALMLRGAPLIVVGAILTAAPSWLFDDGNMHLIGGQVESGARESASLMREGPLGEITVYGPAAKWKALALNGLGPTLEFGELGRRAGRVAGHAWFVLLAIACGLALSRHRDTLTALLRRRPLQGRALLPFWLLLALGLGFAFFSSGMRWDLWYVGAGLENRRLTPVLVALLVLAATSASDGPRARTGALLVGVLCLLGVAGQAPLWVKPAAATSSNRGECYEWYAEQLEQHAGDDFRSVLDAVWELDRGDRRFASLRYRLPRMLPGPKAPAGGAVQFALARAEGWPRLCALTHAGRAMGPDKRAVLELAQQAWLSKLSPVERAALLHGVGLGLERKQPASKDVVEQVEPWFERVEDNLPAPMTEAVFEGLGFALGAVHDPYNRLMRAELVCWSQLPPDAAEAVYRGMGWGYRQRMLAPPGAGDEVALSILEDLPAEAHAAFLDGLRATRLPAEAHALVPPEDG